MFSFWFSVPITVNTSTGDNVTIPCYATSPKSEGCYVLWEKNGEPVLKLEDGVLTPGPTLKDRASVSQDGCEKGDLSLRIAGVLPSDQGLYLCQYSKTRDTDQFRGAPNSARLNVQRANDNGMFLWPTGTIRSSAKRLLLSTATRQLENFWIRITDCII